MDAPTSRCPCCGGPVDPLDILIDAGRQTITKNGETASFSRYEFAVLTLLLNAYPGTVSRDSMYHTLYSDRVNGGPEPKILDVLACKVRKKIKAFDFEINVVWGVGYEIQLTEEGREANARRKSRETQTGRRRTPDFADVTLARQMRKRGYDALMIAQRLRLTMSAVLEVMTTIAAQDLHARAQADLKKDIEEHKARKATAVHGRAPLPKFMEAAE